ncbi:MULTISPECIES: hypothetical protein [unclassified Paenibacillus]|uniref:hypothetical protein n=1 Tax=unclassified Paenibacillus TaxID=185978 RepID=UPI0027D8C662|nr:MULTISPECIES: hypothetical protein [unclassified Paenibacillus]
MRAASHASARPYTLQAAAPPLRCPAASRNRQLSHLRLANKTASPSSSRSKRQPPQYVLHPQSAPKSDTAELTGQKVQHQHQHPPS